MFIFFFILILKEIKMISWAPGTVSVGPNEYIVSTGPRGTHGVLLNFIVHDSQRDTAQMPILARSVSGGTSVAPR